MREWIKMFNKDGEEKLVHPNNVDAHLRQGWRLEESPEAEPVAAVVESPAQDPDIESVDEITEDQPVDLEEGSDIESVDEITEGEPAEEEAEDPKPRKRKSAKSAE
jgi:hypothetical protein